MKSLVRCSAVLAMSLALCGCPRSESDTLKMATHVSFPPYELVRNGEIVGVDVEICRAVADRLGLDFSVESMEFDAVLPAVVSGKADIAASGITITDERKRNVAFSEPYASAGLVVLYRKAVPYKSEKQLKAGKIGVQNGTTAEKFMREEIGKEPKCYRTFDDAVAALKADECDFVLEDAAPANAVATKDAELQVSKAITYEEYAVAVRKGSDILLKAVNDVIREAKADGRLARWSAEFSSSAKELERR
ncbi:MAG: transporter substrate-binding domain-containing protein [Kiritimatiellae bacterium]|nr:transporter substrate-binding domain-containing protein [Kiritimatiellia bacterium]